LLGVGALLSALAGNNLYLFNPYPYLPLDFLTVSANFVHHCYIAALLMLGSFVHISIHLA
jgi:hypothetical protein